MEFREVVEKRSSVRKFTNEDVQLEDLREMVRCAGLAPSVNNSQPWKFISITNKDLMKKMGELVSNKLDVIFSGADEKEKTIKSQVEWFSTFFVDAPAVIVVLSHPYEAVIDKILAKTDFTHKDINQLRGNPDILSIGASLQNLLLSAVDLGYGACWLSGPMVAKEDLEKLLDIKEPWNIATMVAVGKTSGEISKRSKKNLDEIFEYRP